MCSRHGTPPPSRRTLDGVELDFSGEVVWWRGPAPFHFVTVPEEQSAALESASAEISYGWGCIPVRAVIGGTEFRTSLFPREDLYLLPVKVAVRRAEGIELGDVVAVQMSVDV
jgi:hypothetical protein